MTQTPDVASPIRAYRAWIVDGRRLRSMAFETHWDRLMTAECDVYLRSYSTYIRHKAILGSNAAYLFPELREIGEELESLKHDVPSPQCGCGLYATKTLDILRDRYHLPDASTVYGEVDLWGHVEEHDWGFRAEHARIINLHYKARSHRALHRLSYAYGVPLVGDDGRIRSMFAPTKPSKVGFYARLKGGSDT